MRNPLFEPKAAKQTVSITLNSDLYAKSKRLGINASKVAEEALAQEYATRKSATVTAELRRDLEAALNYADLHGSFADLVREHDAGQHDAGEHDAGEHESGRRDERGDEAV